MSEPVGRWAATVVNTTDIDRLAAFWQAVLGVGVRHEIPGVFTWLEAQTDGAPTLAFQRVDDPTEGTRRLHLDLGVADVEAAVARVEELGGQRLADHEIEGFAWVVCADPDGNEFCLGPAG